MMCTCFKLWDRFQVQSTFRIFDFFNPYFFLIHIIFYPLFLVLFCCLNALKVQPWKCWFGWKFQEFSITLGLGRCCSPLSWLEFSMGMFRKINQSGGFSLYNLNFALKLLRTSLGFVQDAEGLLWAWTSEENTQIHVLFFPLEAQINKSPGSAAGPNI